MASDLEHFTSWMVALKCHTSSWILEQMDLGKSILTKHSFRVYCLSTEQTEEPDSPCSTDLKKCRKDKKGYIRKFSGMKVHRRWCFFGLVWFSSLLLDISVHIAKRICFCSDIFMSSFFRKYVLPCFSSLLWQRRIQVLNILRPCSAMDQQEQVFFIIHLTQESEWMISQYVYIFFLVYTTVQIIKLAVGGEAAMYFICSHAIPPPSLPLALKRHPDTSSIAAVGNKEWRSLARVLSLAFLYSVKASLLNEPLVASNCILLEQSVCEQNNLIPLFSTTQEEKGDILPLRTYSSNRCQQTCL